MFVSLTWDDAVNAVTFAPIMEIITGTGAIRDQLGCPLRQTFFVSTDFTNYHLVTQLYARGHEIAAHTVTHATSSLDTSLSTWVSVRLHTRMADALALTCCVLWLCVGDPKIAQLPLDTGHDPREQDQGLPRTVPAAL